MLRAFQSGAVAKQFGKLIGRGEGEAGGGGEIDGEACRGPDDDLMEGVEEGDAVPGVPGSEGFSAADRLLGAVSFCGRMAGKGFPVWRPETFGMIAYESEHRRRFEQAARDSSLLPKFIRGAGLFIFPSRMKHFLSGGTGTGHVYRLNHWETGEAAARAFS